MPTDLKAVLEDAGLSDKETAVYLKLLEAGISSAGELSKATGLDRTLVYDVLEKLVGRGLVAHSLEAGKKVFQAFGPEKLVHSLKEKEQALEEAIKAFGKRKPAEEKTNVLILEGREGIKTALEDILKTCEENKAKEFLTLSWTGNIANYIPTYYRQWEKRRIRKGLKRRAISTEESQEKAREFGTLSEFRFLPKGFRMPTGIVVLENKSQLYLLLDEKPVELIIENRYVAETYRNFFDLLWKISSPSKSE